MNEQKQPDLPLAATAHWTAAARANESVRADHLFDDPYAEALAGPEGMDWIAKRGPLTSAMVIRTRYFDEFLLHAASHTGLRQIVIVAAGYDTRAYRLDWPADTRLFELDQPDVLRHKAQVLGTLGAEPACERVPISTNLVENWPSDLLSGGFDPAQPSAWLLEGFLFYIPTSAIIHMLEEVTAFSVPGSRLGFDIVNCLTLTSPITKAWIEMQAREGAPWIGALDEPETLLAELGWAASITQPGAPDAHYARWTLPIIPVKMPNMPHNWYVTATRGVSA